jgi:hypothetical protein
MLFLSDLSELSAKAGGTSATGGKTTGTYGGDRALHLDRFGDNSD